MKILFYLAYLILYLGQSQPTWKVIYHQQNWDDQDTYPKLNWFFSNIYGGPFSQCGNSKLLGGYSVFGPSSFVSSSITLPPHFSVKITFDFWKIDSWDGEHFRLLIDNETQTLSFWGNQGQNICGADGEAFKEWIEPVKITITPHISSSFVLFMTSTLGSSALDESWGINNFKIEILECPDGCSFCQDSTSACNYWINFATYWSSSDESDFWYINNNQQLGYSKCAFLSIAGGIDNLFKGQSIEKLIQNLPRHFKIHIVVKLWAIGQWNNELFSLEIDNLPNYSFNIYSMGSIFYCSQYQVIIKNIDVNTLHSSQQIKIKMKTIENSVQNAFWGVQSFNLYVAKCSVGCDDCSGDIVSKCIQCIKKWGFLDNECIPAPPLECSHVRMNQVYGLKVNFMNPFEIKINELDLIIKEIGQKQLIVDDIISSISIQIQVQCQEKMLISSFFRNCDRCEADHYSFENDCSYQSNTFIYNAIFLQVVESEKELLITMTQSKIEIVQVSIVNDVETEILILKIEI